MNNIIKDIKISSLIPSTTNKIIWVKNIDSLAHTLEILVKNRIHSVPVFDIEKNKFVAFVDLIDFAVHLGRTYIENEIIEGSVSRMLQEEKHYKTLQIADESGRNPWYTIEDTASLQDAMELIVQHKIHRVAVLDSNGELKYVLTQSDIITFFANHLDSFPLLTSTTIEQLNLGFKDVVTIPTKNKVWKSFIEMNDKKVSGLGISDDSQNLVGHISCGDLKGVEFDSTLMDRLRQSVSEFKTEMNVISVLPSATLSEVISTLEKNKIHRVFILPANSKIPKGVISQIDIISTLLNVLKS